MANLTPGIIILMCALAVATLMCGIAATNHGIELKLDQEALGRKESKERIRKLMKALHAHQHPPKESCKSRRLLVMSFRKTFDSTGCNLKALTNGLAEAVYSNRTLVWGLDLPHQFHHTRVIWQGRQFIDAPHERDYANFGGKVFIDGVHLECEDGWLHQGGGPYSCFFKSLSSCSLEDADMSELKMVGEDGFSNLIRVKLAENRRALAGYHPPTDIPGFSEIFKTNGDDTSNDLEAAKQTFPHEWAASLAGYVFRLKPKVKSAFLQRKKLAWPAQAGGSATCACGTAARRADLDDTITATNSPSVWSLHVRHGDVKALSNVWGNKRWFPFSEYFDAARARAWSISRSPSEGCPVDQTETCTLSNSNTTTMKSLPSAIYVASDSPDIYTEVEKACSPEELDKWPGGRAAAPCIFVGEPSQRIRTEHGSHTAAADGGCWGHRCAIKPEMVLHYRATNNQTTDARAVRIMRSLVESIEDLFLLSQSKYLFATGSSHFSIMGLLLSWAKHGVPRGEADPVTFADKDLVDSGVISSGFLHTSLNKTSKIKPELGHMRWVMLARRFFEGLTDEAIEAPYAATKDEMDNRIRFGPTLPKLPESLFRAEVRRWLGIPPSNSSDGQLYKAFPGECPLPPPPELNASTAQNYAIQLINHGVHHRELHPNQAMLCWKAAADVLRQAESRGLFDKNIITEYKDVLSRNMGDIRSTLMPPFSEGEAAIRQHLTINIAGGGDKREAHQEL